MWPRFVPFAESCKLKSSDQTSEASRLRMGSIVAIAEEKIQEVPRTQYPAFSVA